MITVELHGLEVFGHHGVTEEERRAGQTFLYDVQLEVSDAALSDRIEDAVDYTSVAAAVSGVSEAREFHLVEALAAAVADEIALRFVVALVRVRVRKPAPPGLAAEFAAATVERAGASGARSSR